MALVFLKGMKHIVSGQFKAAMVSALFGECRRPCASRRRCPKAMPPRSGFFLVD